MVYIVEITTDGKDLADEWNQMRTWLDHMKFQAIGFRQVPGGNACRIDFAGEEQASAFAKAFSGQILGRTTA
jgi:hypothetical protein